MNWWRQQSRAIQAGIGCGAILLVCMLCGIIGSVTSNRTAGTSATSAPAVPTVAAVAATAIPARATATPRPATATAVPPTATTGPAPLSTDEEAYTERINRQSQTFRDLFRDFGELNQRLSQNGQLINDRAWTREIGVTLGLMRVETENARQMDAPPRFATAHTTYLQAIEKVDDMTHLYADGLDERNPTKVRQSIDAMNEGARLLQQAADEMRTARNQTN